MAQYISKKRLIPLLIEEGFLSKEGVTQDKNGIGHKQIGFEAFGKDVEAFIHVKDMVTRQRLEDFLQYRLKQKVCRTYSPGRPVVEVRVSYFKAWHWDE